MIDLIAKLNEHPNIAWWSFSQSRSDLFAYSLLIKYRDERTHRRYKSMFGFEDCLKQWGEGFDIKPLAILVQNGIGLSFEQYCRSLGIDTGEAE